KMIGAFDGVRLSWALAPFDILQVDVQESGSKSRRPLSNRGPSLSRVVSMGGATPRALADLHLRLASPQGGPEPPRDDPLRRSAAPGDAKALELLLWSHERMVMGVCRRVLRDVHDAEDAFQATFLVLARKARSIAARRAVTTWLYTVAYRVALNALKERTRR